MTAEPTGKRHNLPAAKHIPQTDEDSATPDKAELSQYGLICLPKKIPVCSLSHCQQDFPCGQWVFPHRHWTFLQGQPSLGKIEIETPKGAGEDPEKHCPHLPLYNSDKK